jgi:hypothetical protein
VEGQILSVSHWANSDSIKVCRRFIQDDPYLLVQVSYEANNRHSEQDWQVEAPEPEKSPTGQGEQNDAPLELKLPGRHI